MEIEYLVFTNDEDALEYLRQARPDLKIMTADERGHIILTTLTTDEPDMYSSPFTLEQMTELLVQSHIKRIKEMDTEGLERACIVEPTTYDLDQLR